MCFQRGGLQGWDARRWVRFCDVGVFWAAGCVFLVAVVQGWDARRWVRFCDVGVFWPRDVFSARAVYKVGMRGSGASRGGRDGNCAPVQAKFQKLSRKPSKGSLCGAVSACERRWQSEGRGEVFIVGGEFMSEQSESSSRRGRCALTIPRRGRRGAGGCGR